MRVVRVLADEVNDRLRLQMHQVMGSQRVVARGRFRGFLMQTSAGQDFCPKNSSWHFSGEMLFML
jgi:hypothetical protein